MSGDGAGLVTQSGFNQLILPFAVAEIDENG